MVTKQLGNDLPSALIKLTAAEISGKGQPRWVCKRALLPREWIATCLLSTKHSLISRRQSSNLFYPLCVHLLRADTLPQTQTKFLSAGGGAGRPRGDKNEIIDVWRQWYYNQSTANFTQTLAGHKSAHSSVITTHALYQLSKALATLPIWATKTEYGHARREVHSKCC